MKNNRENPNRPHKLIKCCIFVCILVSSSNVHSQQPAEQVAEELYTEIIQRDLVTYPSGFFDRYQPITALDMVNQVPGFQLDSSNNNFIEVRGFSESAGNVLIDDRRPSTKSDSLDNILSRIPASSVEKIELIRSQVRNIDMRGQSVVVNLVLREGIPASIQWESTIRQTFGHGPITPALTMSYSDTWEGVDINLGINSRFNGVGREGTEDSYDSNGDLIESRLNDRVNRNFFITPNLNAAFWWGETLVHINSNYTYTDRLSDTDSDRTDLVNNSREFLRFEHDEVADTIELSLDMERNFTNVLQGKGIFLFNSNKEDFQDIQIDVDGIGSQSLFRIANGEIDSSELIGRVEFDWLGFDNHLIQANAERAHNVLDSNLVQTDDRGAGPLPVDVPGANSRVQETRWDFLIKDNWDLGRIEFEYGLGAEASTISQTGDAELVRDFFFLKPQMILNYSSLERDQTRLRFAREIAQLNLEDFVSATEFLDNDVALGNPNIKPDATWKLELSHEKRFGRAGVVKLTLFYDWISDVLDLLPLTPDFEAPGNIGNGRRWGAIGEGTLPLDWIGLANAKLDFKLRVQDSTVVDPVTGDNRSLSIPSISGGPVTFDIENKYAFTLEFRQDIRHQQWAWGWELWERGKQLRYKVNELEIYNEGAEFRAFIETTRWWGIKMRIQGENILNFADIRQRRKFVGERGLSPLATRELRDQTRGARLAITLSGNF